MNLEIEQYWTFGLALLIVLILIGILFWVIQKLGGGPKGRRGSRLGIVEAAVVDRSRRLVLIRRDAVEHLVMIGGAQDVVVETNITKHEPSLTAAASDMGAGPGFAAHPGAQAAVSAEPILSEPHIEDTPVVAEATVAEPEAAAPPPPPPAPQPAAETPPPPEPEPQPEPQPVAAEEPQPRPEAPPPRKAPEEAPRPAAPARPWPPSEGRFREAQRRFAERSDYNPPGRGGRHDPSQGMEGHQEPERQVANRAAPDGMPPPEPPRDASHEGATRQPANLNVRPGEDR